MPQPYQTQQQRVLAAALEYAALGIHVLPVYGMHNGDCGCGRSGCTSCAKHPAVNGGVKSGTTDKRIIQNWFAADQSLNIGICTGLVSGIFVVDADSKSGGLVSIENLQGRFAEFPTTWVALTGGGGRHIIFRYPPGGDVACSVGKIAPGTDIRGDGGYAVAVPSIHASGNPYAWQEGRSPADVPLADAPTWLLELLRKVRQRRAIATVGIGERGFVAEGGRNEAVFRRACRLRRDGADAQTILVGIGNYNQQFCQPPLADDELQRIAQSAARYDPGSPPLGDNDGSNTEVSKDVLTNSGPHYEEMDGATYLVKHTNNGPTAVMLANLTARITEEVIHDDGVERTSVLTLVGEGQEGRTYPAVSISAASFASMSWMAAHWGAGAILTAGTMNKEHMRVAIQRASSGAHRRTVYMHTGWRKLEEQWSYLTSTGAISGLGLDPTISVELGGKMAGYALPVPPTGSDLRQAVDASLRVLQLARPEVAYPLLAGVYRSVLSEFSPCPMTLFVVGRTGAQKTELAALAQAHFGKVFNGRNLPASWHGTANANERLAHLAKDAVLVVDDFHPAGSRTDVGRMHLDAERLLRAASNQSGRARMRADSTLRPEYTPRGLIIATGEDIPRGHSLRARLMILEIARGDVDLGVLTRLQGHAAAGHLAGAMAAFVKWLAPQADALKQRLRGREEDLRDAIRRGGRPIHDRAPDQAAALFAAMEEFTRFCVDVGSLSHTQGEQYRLWCWDALLAAGALQAEYQRHSDPAVRFLELLSAAIASGAAHVAALGGNRPVDAENWGWRDERGQGPLIGYVKDGDLYLLLDSAFAVAQDLASRLNEAMTIGPDALPKRMREAGLLVSVDEQRGKNLVRLTTVPGRPRTATLHIKANLIVEPTRTAPIQLRGIGPIGPIGPGGDHGGPGTGQGGVQ